MSNTFTIYVENTVIYEGSFSEMPDEQREKLTSALLEWGDILGKKSINELLYSSFYWYLQKQYYCSGCDEFSESEDKCPCCDTDVEQKYVHNRNENIDKILDCIGMISRIEIVS